MDTIINMIKSGRDSEELNKTELAKACGVTVQYICMIEDGTKEPSLKFIKNAAQVLKLDLKKIKAELLKLEAAKIDEVFLD